MTSKESSQTSKNIPRHVAIIMDGNGRWAKKRGLPRVAGHRAGTENLRTIIRASAEFGIEYLTLYAFSTENWSRPQAEITGLMNILSNVIDREMGELHKEGARLMHIGHLDGLSKNLKDKIRHAIDLTKNNKGITIVLAFNYGGRDEIIHAFKHLLSDGVKAEEVNAGLISKYMFTRDIPDPDLVIRTSGEQRTSNFLTWQTVYSEWYFPKVYWPDFDKEELRKALQDFADRDRRFGGLKNKS
ncbi:MAG: isoprenyl transferase [Chloroflexota bacterium]|nr:isoprenyl transferase [Chloroflexota bacterium]